MANPPRRGRIGQSEMYHILASQRHRQDGAFFRKYQSSRPAAADPPGLVELAAAVLASVGGMDQQMHLAGPGGGLDSVGAVDQRAAARFEPQAVERGLAQSGGDAVAEV